jgi:type VI secretion system protein
MALKLRVISDHNKALGKRSSQLFGVSGGRIGRATDNDWILPDPDRYVSSHHAKVSFRAGQWLLEDTSTNGTFINGSDTPASVEGTYTLKDGDRLRLGEYELIVSIDERNDFSSDESGQIPAPKRVRNAPSAVKAATGAPKAPKPEEDLGEELDITDLLSESLIQAAPPPPRNFDPPMTSFELTQALGLDIEPPKPATKPQRSGFASLLENAPAENTQARKPDDWQMQTRPYDRRTMTALTSPAALAIPKKDEPERPKRADGATTLEPSSGIEAFCRGAGIDPSTLPADAQSALLTLAGQMVREVVLGLMDTLKGRADLKNRLRLSQTTIQPGENNPLKFSASVDEAVHKLLDPHGSRYLGPIEAIRDSFADLRTHQTALVGAIQAAADELMNRIEPGELQERFDRGLKRGPLLGATNKMKYWELYGEFYQVINQRNEQGLPTLFAEELARTYAERSIPKKK